MDRLIGKALLEVHKDKQSMSMPAMGQTQTMAQQSNKSDIRQRIVFKQDVVKKVINLKDLAHSRQTSKHIADLDGEARANKGLQTEVSTVSNFSRQTPKQESKMDVEESDGQTTLFLRNLPDNFRDQRQVGDLLPRDVRIAGLRVDNGTAEMYFRSKAEAERARGILIHKLDCLNQTKIQGRAIKAQLLDNLNDSLKHHKGDLYKKSAPKVNYREKPERNEISKQNSSMESARSEDDKPAGKGSILQRIKRHR